MNTTRDGITVERGQVWRNCDRRTHGATRTVVDVRDGFATMARPGSMRHTHVAIRRMYKHSTGWELVK